MAKTYLRVDSDTIEDAKRYSSKRAAIEAYATTARELAKYEQRCEASLHYARSADELNEYPDFTLSLGPRGGIKCERT